MSRYLITGGTGLIGTALIESLRSTTAKFTVLTRDKQRASRQLSPTIDLIESFEELASDSHFDYVINLAGEPIADKPWSVDRKLKLWQSRVELTNRLVVWLSQLEKPPKALISGSAIGWYGDGENEILDEQSQPHHEYTHNLCDAWEKAALKAVASGVRVCLIRTGLVLSTHGGFLQRLKLPFQLGLGATLGSGKQYMSWIHIDDLIRGIVFLLDEKGEGHLAGVFNLTSPNPVTNKEFTKTLAKVLGRPTFIRVPKRFLSLTLGEMSRLLTTGQRVMPANLLSHNFEFRFKSLSSALEDVLK